MREVEEVGDRVFVLRHEYLDVNIGLVAGTAGLLVVDTLWSEAAARSAVERLRAALGPAGADVAAVVNTHDHWDHVLGNAALSGPALAPVFASEYAAAAVARLVPEAPPGSLYAAEVAAATVVVADRTFSSVASVDLGDRLVELLHLGRGHTGGDVVVRVPDAEVLFAGDLVEESAPPAYGDDCFPLDWPGTLELVGTLLAADTVVVPGHGAPVRQAFVDSQRADVAAVAETIRDLKSRGVPLDEALGRGQWPFEPGVLLEAVRRGYAQLPEERRALPLV